MKKHRRSNIPDRSLCGRVYRDPKDLALVNNPWDVTCYRCQDAIGSPNYFHPGGRDTVSPIITKKQ